MHYSNLNGCNSGMLYVLRYCFKENTQQIIDFNKAINLTQLQLSLSTVHFFVVAFLTQHLGLSIFDPNLG